MKPFPSFCLLLAFLGAASSLAGLTGCTSARPTFPAPPARAESPGVPVEDRRTAERVREALAAAAGYKFDAVRVEAREGVVQLSGLVHTNSQRSAALDVASKVKGVKDVVDNLAIGD